MGLSGAASSAAEGLEELLARQMLEAKLEEEKRQNAAREAMAQRQLEQNAREHQDMMQYRTQSLEQEDRGRRDRANAAGVEDMYKQRGVMKEEEDERAIGGVIQGLPESARPLVELQRRGVKVNAEDIESPEQRAARDAREIEKEGKTAEARARAQARYRAPDKKGGGGEDGKPSDYTLGHSLDVVRKVDDLMPRIGILTAGPIGSVLSNIGGTDASNVSADLESLAANVAFDQLQRMREASKTGGALGQVAVREIELLQNAEASIRQNQSPANLRKNLQAVRASAQRFIDAAGGSAQKPGDQKAPGGPADLVWDGKKFVKPGGQ